MGGNATEGGYKSATMQANYGGNLKMKTPENLKEIMNEADYLQWLKYEEKGKRLGAIINDPKQKSIARDAAAGAKKLFNQKRKLYQRI